MTHTRGIPLAVGSVPLAFACTTGEPVPSGDGVDGDWSLREVILDEGTVTWPQVYESEFNGCVYSTALDLRIAGDEATMTYTYGTMGCDDPMDDYVEVANEYSEVLPVGGGWELNFGLPMNCEIDADWLVCEVTIASDPGCSTFGTDTNDSDETSETGEADAGGEESGGCGEEEDEIEMWRFERQ